MPPLVLEAALEGLTKLVGDAGLGEGALVDAVREGFALLRDSQDARVPEGGREEHPEATSPRPSEPWVSTELVRERHELLEVAGVVVTETAKLAPCDLVLREARDRGIEHGLSALLGVDQLLEDVDESAFAHAAPSFSSANGGACRPLRRERALATM